MSKTIEQTIRRQVHPSFRFVISIGGKKNDGVFTECTLPVIEWELQQVKEGGLNSYVHQLPGPRKAATITLKNGIGDQDLFDWYIQAMNGNFVKKSISITMQNVAGNAFMQWDIQNAMPTKWTGPQFNASSNDIAIQTLVLACGKVSVKFAQQAKGATQ